MNASIDKFISVLALDESLFEPTSELSSSDLRKAFLAYAEEAKNTFNLIEPSLNKEMSILEVGSGPSILTAFLVNIGYNVSAVEPVDEAFGEIRVLKDRIIKNHAQISFPLIDQLIENVLKADYGQFDFIFSSNVLEHVQDPEKAIQNMLELMCPNGHMLHSCPNYEVPYEPHFGIITFHWWPSFSKLFWGKKIKREIKLWDSLNFITARQVNNIVNAQDANVVFHKGVMAEAFSRVSDDPNFAQRHSQGIVGAVTRFVHRFGLLAVLKRFPATLSTPMIFQISKRN